MLGVEVVVIAALIMFLLYINSTPVKINHQQELAQHYLLEEDYEQAIAAFEIIIDIDPKNVEAYLGMAKAYAASDDLESAVKILEEASKQMDSEEILATLKVHISEIEQREQSAQREAKTTETDVVSTKETNALVEQEIINENLLVSESNSVTTGFVTQDGELYYYDDTGNLVTGWFDENNNRYCARDDGRLYRDGQHEIDSTKYLFDQKGICLGEMEGETWKQAYIDFVKQKHQEFWAQYSYDNQPYDRYALIYVDNDDIPELVITPRIDVQYNASFIVSYANGSVYSNPDCWAMSYIERGELFYAIKDYDDISATVQIFRIQDGRQTVIAEGYYSEVYDEWPYFYYEWDGVQLTEEEFEGEISKVYDRNREIQLDTQYTYEEILDKIANY